MNMTGIIIAAAVVGIVGIVGALGSLGGGGLFFGGGLCHVPSLHGNQPGIVHQPAHVFGIGAELADAGADGLDVAGHVAGGTGLGFGRVIQ